MGNWGIGVFQSDGALEVAADIRDAPDANDYIESFLREFLSGTEGGYDSSAYSGEWARARRAIAVCEVVRLGMPEIDVSKERIPPTISEWLRMTTFRASQVVRRLAVTACHRLVESQWLKHDDQEFWALTLAPLEMALASQIRTGVDSRI